MRKITRSIFIKEILLTILLAILIFLSTDLRAQEQFLDDSFGSFNRRAFKFSDAADRMVLRAATPIYRKMAPCLVTNWMPKKLLSTDLKT